MILLKGCIQHVSKSGKLRSSHRTGKGQFSFQSQRRVVPMNVQSTEQLRSFCMLCSKAYAQNPSSSALEVHELKNFQIPAGYRKGRGTRDQIANIHWITQKEREFRKNTYFASLTMLKPLTVWITIYCGKFFKRWEYQIT